MKQFVSINDFLFRFPEICTIDAIFVVLQLHKKYLAVDKILYLVFVDLEKAFICVPRKVIW